MFLVDVSPDISMYNLLKNQGYDPAYALGEFVDNALQAHINQTKSDKRRKFIEVSINFFSIDYPDFNLKNSIIIRDNGPGITKENLINAMKPAKPNSTKGLNEFGIGMKASAVWFTDNWELITKPESEDFKYLLNFNLGRVKLEVRHKPPN